jgi:hypothetical protein
MVPSGTPTILLNCWVMGEPENRGFQISIDYTATVSTLKDKIKSHKLYSIPSDALVLWDTSLSPNATAEKLDDKDALKPFGQLSSIFSMPLQLERIHVTIHCPTLGE